MKNRINTYNDIYLCNTDIINSLSSCEQILLKTICSEKENMRLSLFLWGKVRSYRNTNTKVIHLTSCAMRINKSLKMRQRASTILKGHAIYLSKGLELTRSRVHDLFLQWSDLQKYELLRCTAKFLNIQKKFTS